MKVILVFLALATIVQAKGHRTGRGSRSPNLGMRGQTKHTVAKSKNTSNVASVAVPLTYGPIGAFNNMRSVLATRLGVK